MPLGSAVCLAEEAADLQGLPGSEYEHSSLLAWLQKHSVSLPLSSSCTRTSHQYHLSRNPVEWESVKHHSQTHLS